MKIAVPEKMTKEEEKRWQLHSFFLFPFPFNLFPMLEKAEGIATGKVHSLTWTEPHWTLEARDLLNSGIIQFPWPVSFHFGKALLFPNLPHSFNYRLPSSLNYR